MDKIESCDIVLFVVTDSEVDALEVAAKELQIPVAVREGPLGKYRWLGTVGHTRVLAAKTGMGALDFRGAGSRPVCLAAAQFVLGALAGQL